MVKPRRAGRLCASKFIFQCTCLCVGFTDDHQVVWAPLYLGDSKFQPLLLLSCMLCIQSYISSHDTKLGYENLTFLVVVEEASVSSFEVVPFLVLIQWGLCIDFWVRICNFGNASGQMILQDSHNWPGSVEIFSTSLNHTHLQIKLT